jgi:mannose-6-phosphate isomerase-like protein (cupin superfamily)
VRAWFGDEVHVFELEPEDACFLPAGSRHEYRNAGGTAARAICGIAPRYLP